MKAIRLHSDLNQEHLPLDTEPSGGSKIFEDHADRVIESRIRALMFFGQTEMFLPAGVDVVIGPKCFRDKVCAESTEGSREQP